MQHFFVKIIDKTVRVSFETDGECEAKKSFLKQYRPYLLPVPVKRPDLTVLVRRVYKHIFIQREKTSFISLFHEKDRNTLVFSENQSDYLNQIFFKIVMQTVIFRQKLFLTHASASLVNGRAVIFIGKSGAGKSTIVQLLRPWYKPLADDMAILEQKNKEIYLYQVPFREKNNYPKQNKSYPVSRIYVLKQSSSVRFRSLSDRNSSDYLVKICGNLLVNDNRKAVAEFAFGLHGRITELSFSLEEPFLLAKHLGQHEGLSQCTF